MAIIAFTNQKGGVGKTTCAVNIAAALGLYGNRTLLCDIDPQGNATSGVGLDKRKRGFTTYELLSGMAEGKDVVCTTSFANLSAMPSSLSLAACELEFSSLDDRHGILSRALDSVKNDFDYIIIDCPPSLGLLTINGICASDGVIVPMQCEFYSLEGLSQQLYTLNKLKRLYNHALEIIGIIVTMYSARLNLSIQVMNELKKYYSDKLFSTAISRSVRLSEAPGYGMPIQYFDKNCKSAKLYNALANEIIDRINEQKPT